MLARASGAKASLAVRFALLLWRLDETRAGEICERLRVPNEERDLAIIAVRHAAALGAAHQASPAALLRVLKGTDAFRRRERFLDLLTAYGLADPGDEAVRGTQRLGSALQAAEAVDAGAVAAGAASGGEIAARIEVARERAIAAALTA
jgi:tRNA nucleotidyltransferase (CCA-adding enzyme)